MRPFSKLRFLVLDYDLTDKRVSSGSGGTIDRSDLGTRIEAVCAGPSNPNQKLTFDDAGFLRKIETYDQKGNLLELFEWQDLKINQKFPNELFTKF